MAYHQINDSGICLEDDLELKQLQTAEDYGPNPSITSCRFPLYPRVHRSIHYNQLTEIQRSQWLSGCYDIPILSQESPKVKILSGYPIPYHYALVPYPDSQINQHPREQPEPVDEEPTVSEPSEPKRCRIRRQEKVERFFDMVGGRTPRGYKNFLRKFPSEYEYEEARYLRWHAAEVMKELTILSRHHGPLCSYSCNWARSHSFVGNSGLETEKEGLPERWFNSIEEAWAHRPKLDDDSPE